ncbi:MAG: hypothetical protein KGL39_48740 [Patescibacteria group bacterium]|nr:hypothetical protein [Patescibacteria group bacterium]
MTDHKYMRSLVDCDIDCKQNEHWLKSYSRQMARGLYAFGFVAAASHIYMQWRDQHEPREEVDQLRRRLADARAMSEARAQRVGELEFKLSVALAQEAAGRNALKEIRTRLEQVEKIASDKSLVDADKQEMLRTIEAKNQLISELRQIAEARGRTIQTHAATIDRLSRRERDELKQAHDDIHALAHEVQKLTAERDQMARTMQASHADYQCIWTAWKDALDEVERLQKQLNKRGCWFW